MLLGIWQVGFVLLVFLHSYALGSFIGVNIGSDMSSLPPASNIVSILQARKIKHVRLYDAEHQLLTALANTGIEVMVGIPNEQLLQIGVSKTSAADWVNKNIVSYLPATNITYIAVGNEALTSDYEAALVLVPAMQFIYSALLAANLESQIHVSTPHSINTMLQFFPPSTATFMPTLASIMHQCLQFFKNTGSSFMLNAQPYYSYIKGNGIFPVDFALFRLPNPGTQIMDPNTLISYANMFDAMVDAAYYSTQALNFSGISIIVTQSGWPSTGGDNETDANVDNAATYNTNLIRRMLQSDATSSHPEMLIGAYVYELFNEDLRPGPLSEKNWGILFPNGTDVYSLSFTDAVDEGSPSPDLDGLFCVANLSSISRDLKQGLDWVCGSGRANCSYIQPGQPCYESGNISSIASYAYNDYYHRTRASGGTCDFGSTAMITTRDPSHGLCIFAGSSTGKNSTPSNGTAFDSSPSSGFARWQAFSSEHIVLVILQFALFMFFY